jgi:hypothetical protein
LAQAGFLFFARNRVSLPRQTGNLGFAREVHRPIPQMIL